MKQAGYVLGVFGLSLAFVLIWLVISKIIPPLRERVGLSYGIAAVLAFVPPFIAPGILNFIGPVLCAGLILWQYGRDRKRLAEAKEAAKRHKGRKSGRKS